MKRAILVFAFSVVASRAQVGCGTQLQPLRPLTPIGCADLKLLCLCGPTGNNCHWDWVCTQAPAPANASSIPLQVRPPQINDALDSAIKAEQLRQLRLQNAAAEEQIPAQQRPLSKRERRHLEKLHREQAKAASEESPIAAAQRKALETAK
jgi:hypothetical protein